MRVCVCMFQDAHNYRCLHTPIDLYIYIYIYIYVLQVRSSHSTNPTDQWSVPSEALEGLGVCSNGMFKSPLK